MFKIDRTYIDTETAEETLQSTIIYIRSKYRNSPTLPKVSEYGRTDEEYEEYIDKKQDLAEWEKKCKKKGPGILAVLFCIPPVVVNIYDKSNLSFYLSFLASIILVVCIIIGAKAVLRARNFSDDACDAYTEALLKWHEKMKEEEAI